MIFRPSFGIKIKFLHSETKPRIIRLRNQIEYRQNRKEELGVVKGKETTIKRILL